MNEHIEASCPVWTGRIANLRFIYESLLVSVNSLFCVKYAIRAHYTPQVYNQQK
jgi:hypothetical protein